MNTTKAVDRLYSPDQVARILGCGKTKVYAFLTRLPEFVGIFRALLP